MILKIPRRLRENLYILSAPLGIFLIALIPRILSLGSMVTCDEPLWLLRAPSFMNAFLSGNLSSTYQIMHPGVTLMWIAGIPIKLFWADGMGYGEKLFIASFPVAFVITLGIVIVYFLLKKAFNGWIAVLGTLLLALDPFFLGHSRVLQLDGLLSIFMIISFLAMFVYLMSGGTRYLATAGIGTGLAILTKASGAFLILFLVMMAMTGQFYIYCVKGKNSNSAYLFSLAKTSLVLIGVAVITFFILWPTMWVDPLNTLNKYIHGMEWAVTTPHEEGGFFLGDTSGNYGLSFYIVVLLMRSNPLSLVFAFVALAFLSVNFIKRRITACDLGVVFLFLLAALFIIQMTLGEKKFDRYILPVFLAVDLMGAVGIYYMAEALRKWFRRPTRGTGRRGVDIYRVMVIVLVIVINLSLLLPLHPYYLAYYNPIVPGNPSNAHNVLLVGWGEGQDIAAAYLNEKPDASNLTVAIQYIGFQQYFKGKTVMMNTNVRVDYMVFYVTAVQRHWNQDMLDRLNGTRPEKVIMINGIDYCWIFNTSVSASSAAS